MYLSQAKWQAMWKKAMRLEYDPSVDVRKAYNNTAKTVSEAMKYETKVSETVLPHDWDLSVKTVMLLDKALNNRRFSAFGGAMKTWHKKLNLDDAENGDLIHLGDEPAEEKSVTELEIYWWSGLRENYIRSTKPVE